MGISTTDPLTETPMTNKTTRKTTRKTTPRAPETEGDLIAFMGAIKDAHYDREDHMTNTLVGMVQMGLPFGARMLAHAVVKAAEHVLRLEHGMGGVVTPDVARARVQYTKTLTAARNALKGDFDAHYADCVKTHNECARANLDNSKGCSYTYVVPAFNDDGTHPPIGPKDFPWAQEV